MREIKFRAWDKKEKRMRPAVNVFRFGDDSEWNFVWAGEECDEKNLLLMQYTGLKDKNGREIYEGDIVKNSIREPHEWSGLHEVKFDSGRFVLFGGNPRGIRCGEIFNYYPMNVEIIGNIYENPELLNRHC